MTLCIKADSELVEIILFENNKELITNKWNAGRELSEKLIKETEIICNSVAKKLSDIIGVVVYEGPGSYTGLRISTSFANSLGYSYNIPVVGTSGNHWISDGLKMVKNIDKFYPISPVYGGEVYTTKPKK